MNYTYLSNHQDLTKEAKDLIDYLADLSRDLKYPNCEGNLDAVRCLNQAVIDLKKLVKGWK